MLLGAQFIPFDGKKVIFEKIVYLAPFKDLDLPTPQISYEVNELQDHFQVVIRTQKLAKNVFVSAGSGLNFSDNYFDMLPNTTKTITVKKDDLADLKSFRVKLNVTSLVDTY
jgi:beta-mannosidase